MSTPEDDFLLTLKQLLQRPAPWYPSAPLINKIWGDTYPGREASRGERFPCLPFTEGSEGTEWPAKYSSRRDRALYSAAPL